MARIGNLTFSDRASAGIYADESGPAIAEVFGDILVTPFEAVSCIVLDGVESVRDAHIGLIDDGSIPLRG